MVELKILKAYISASCDIWGEAFNVLLRDLVFSDVDVDPNKLAAFVGYLLGLYKEGKVPRHILCLDLVKALRIEKDYDEQRVYGELDPNVRNVRELQVIPKLEDLLGKASMALHKHALQYFESPDEAIQAVEESYRNDHRLERYSFGFDDLIWVELCYKDPRIAEALEKVKHGGIVSALLSNAIAKKHGFTSAKFLRVERSSKNCVKFLYEPIKRFLLASKEP